MQCSSSKGRQLHRPVDLPHIEQLGTETTADAPSAKKRSQKKTSPPITPAAPQALDLAARPPLPPTPCTMRTHDYSLLHSLNLSHAHLASNHSSIKCRIFTLCYPPQHLSQTIQSLSPPPPSFSHLTHPVSRRCEPNRESRLRLIRAHSLVVHLLESLTAGSPTSHHLGARRSHPT